MSNPYSFEIARDLLNQIGAEARKPGKDCSAKWDKVDKAEKAHKAAKAAEHDAAIAAREALEEYRLWAGDPVKGPHYYQVYLKRHEAWVASCKETSKAKEKLDDAKDGAHHCEASKYAG
jgi:hypothetical protein